MVGVSSIPLDYMTRHDIPEIFTTANENNNLKYQATRIDPAWEVDKMNVYTKLKFCCLYREGCSCIKAYNSQKDLRQATANLRENYEVTDEVNKHVAWATAYIDNTHFTSKHNY